PYAKIQKNMLYYNDLTIPWVDGLELRTSANYRNYTETHKKWRKDPALYSWESEVPIYLAQPQLFHDAKNEASLTMQYFAEYKNTFGAHFVNVLGGYESTSVSGDYYSEKRTDYAFPFDQMNIGPAGTQTNSGYEWDSGRAGWIGQLKYNYDNRYFVEASMRYDGSDNFPKNRRWGTFYSGSLGWVLSDEAFTAPLKDKHIIDLLKLRASYGQVGLDNWGDENDPYHLWRFEYLTSYNYSPKGYVMDGKYVPSFTEGSIPSPDITWFTTNQSNMGFDFASLNNRLYGSFDYFYYQTTGFLYAPDPLKTGYTDPLGQSLPRIKTNGELRRGGIEFQLGWRDNIGNFKYDISANYTRYKEFWNRQPTEAPTSLMNPYTRSTQAYNYYGTMLTNLGYYKDANDVLNSPKAEASYNLTGGDIKYKDVNGDGKIDNADHLRLGNPSKPRSNYGININLGYKGWGFSMLLQGAPKFDMYAGDALRMSSGQTAGGMNVIYDFQTNYWTPENVNAMFPRLMSNTGLNGYNNYQYSDFWLINGAYIRLKDFNLNYDFKYKLLKKINWLSTCRVSFTGQNVFTFSDVTKYGLDPENSSMENYGYPNERVFAINLNLGF
ncbi:MAG: SusC/RagA family TonB-linked outer membrane protein, partial [Bacteroidia bacterium]|nr:SusC/RagA family TonB-linked outer membrane protein [Bacteroidia bacterium]